MSAGRFAPSPTGPLHLGSLLAATASYLDARANQLDWQLRIDDLDTPRNQPGAEAEICRALEAHGLHWDGPMQRQSARIDRYQAALEALARQCFYCRCSRRSLADQPVYPGTCRSHSAARSDSAVRIRVNAEPITFTDLVMGPQSENLASTLGDFIIRRRDGLIAYQLATAVDDGAEEICRVVRGRDLLDNTARQIFLIRQLGLSEPEYAHVPTLIYANGQKLSKQHGAPGVVNAQATDNLTLVLKALGIELPADLRGAPAPELLGWATGIWHLENLPDTDQVLNT